MAVNKVVESLIKYSELVIKDMPKYKDTGVPPNVFLNYSNLMTTMVEMQVEGKITDSMKDKISESLRELGIKDTDNVIHKKEEDKESKKNKKEGSSDTYECQVEVLVLGDIKKCFGEECKKEKYTILYRIFV